MYVLKEVRLMMRSLLYLVVYKFDFLNIIRLSKTMSKKSGSTKKDIVS